ncbi:hypothetical protein MMC18_004072 [Xylographa bjoerkii]|nr:hypothetical protein [Xylographa bjoerkii]
MSFCAFPTVRRPPYRRPSLAIDLTDLGKIEEHTDKLISTLKQHHYATTPLHTTDIIASEYMYPSSTTPMESEHFSVHSSRDSLQSIDDLHSLGFYSQDDLDTPLSSLASSPSTRQYPLTSLAKSDLSSQTVNKSDAEQLYRWKSSVSRRHDAKLQESTLRRGKESVSSHKSAKPEVSAKLSKSLPPLPPQLNSRNLLHSDDPRASVARKIAAMGNKVWKDNSGSTSIKHPYEARRAAGADEERKGSFTKLTSLKVQPARKALPIAPLSPAKVSKPELPALKVKTSRKAPPTASLSSLRAMKPEHPKNYDSKLLSRTSSSSSVVLFPVQTTQPSDHVSNDMLMLPVVYPKQPLQSQTVGKSSSGLHVLTGMTSKPIICDNPFVNKSSNTGDRAVRSNLREKAIPDSMPSSRPSVDDRSVSHPNIFPSQIHDKRPTPPPALTSIHLYCYQSHRNMNNSKNDIAQVPCMACKGDDKELRWKCSWCCLRICSRCMEILDDTKDRSLNGLLQARQKRNLANEPWHIEQDWRV